MGCDIHGFIEVRKESGGWWHYSEMPRARNYAFFAMVADVRNNDQKYISKPKGLPQDIGLLADAEHYDMKEDAHSESWLNLTELQSIVWPPEIHIHYVVMLNTMKNLAIYYGEENVRMVFWFDN